jgi:predicted ATPase
MKIQILADPVLVGRERELEELQSFLNSAIEGKGKTVLVSGEAGSGKTRIAHEFLNSARKKGVAVMAGWCLSDTAAPYFPFIEAFNNYYAALPIEEEQPTSPYTACLPLGTSANSQIETEEREITGWLTGPKQLAEPGKPEALSPQVWKDQAFGAITKTLHLISTQAPVVLFIEDIHWADSASLSLLQYIARVVKDSERVLVLATFRSEELTAEVEGKPNPLVETMRRMKREELFTEIKLSNLTQNAVVKMAEAMMGGTLQSKFAEKLAKESGGNSLFVVESLRMLHERKGLVQENNEWRLVVDEFGIPSKIKDIILRRLAVLKYAQRRVLDAASVIGEKFNPDLLAAVLGQDCLDVLETLNLIAQSTSIVCVEENSYRFDHAKSREVLYEELSLPLKRGYHARIAERLEKETKQSFSDLAFHFAQAGNEEKAMKYSLVAGQDELARFSNSEALKHFNFVIKAVGEKPEYAKEKETALEGAGDALYNDNKLKEAMKTFEDLANTTKTEVTRLRAYRKAMNSTFEFGDVIHLSELVNKAEPYAAADRLESAMVLVQRGRVFALHNNYSEALKDYEEALRVYEEEYPIAFACALPNMAFLAMMGVGIASPNQSRPQEGVAEVLRMIAMAQEIGIARNIETAPYCWAGYVLNMCLLEPEALRKFGKVFEIEDTTKVGGFGWVVRASAFSAWSFVQMGNFQAALPYALKALELSKKTDSENAKGLAYSTLARLYTRLGHMEDSEEFFEKLMKLQPEILLQPYVRGQLTKAIFYAGKSQWKEANQYFKETFEEFKVNPGASGFIVESKLHYAWALENQGRLEEAKAQLEEAQAIRDEAQARFEHANVRAYLMVRRQVEVREEFEMRLDLVSTGRKTSTLVRINGIVPIEFEVSGLPYYCTLQGGSLEFKEKSVEPFQVETIKLKLSASKAFSYTLNPELSYEDEFGATKTFKLNPITITVKPAKPPFEALPGRVNTGTTELDRLLSGGIPEGYAVVLAAPSSDERNLLIKHFLETGAQAGETTYYITAETGTGKAMAEKYASDFYLFLCNPRADIMMQSLPNVVRLKGVENLTEIDIALTKAFRTLNPSAAGPRRACIEIVSDALLQHHAVITRKWLSALLPDLKAKGFTTLAVIDPQMHPPEESRAIISLFDGEIAITEKETAKGPEKTLRVRKLVNQKYLEGELALTKEKLSP